jgi:hypothetical protein
LCKKLKIFFRLALIKLKDRCQALIYDRWYIKQSGREKELKMGLARLALD